LGMSIGNRAGPRNRNAIGPQRPDLNRFATSEANTRPRTGGRSTPVNSAQALSTELVRTAITGLKTASASHRVHVDNKQAKALAVLTEKTFKQFKKDGIKDIEKHFSGKTVRVTGQISKREYRGYGTPLQVELFVSHPSQLEVVN